LFFRHHLYRPSAIKTCTADPTRAPAEVITTVTVIAKSIVAEIPYRIKSRSAAADAMREKIIPYTRSRLAGYM
jgi:hypothetical protein